MKLAPTMAATLACCAFAACTPSPHVVGGPGLPSLQPQEAERLWATASSFDAYVAGLGDAQAAAWQRGYEETVVREDFEARAGVIPGTMRVLAVAEADCAACAATLPALEKLAERVPGVQFRISTPDRAAAVLEPHRRAAGPPQLPVVVVLNEAYAEMGCWAAEARTDAGAASAALDGVITVMERAERGARRCP